jgi:cytochrome o ubiquinol oxidase operon protein cyoD
MIDSHHGWNMSYKPQFIAFVVSLILTIAAYRIVSHYQLSDTILMFTIAGLGVLQALFQLVFFMHLGLEEKPHWGMMTFLFMVLVIIVVIGGTLWIMSNLDYNLMPSMHHMKY